MGLIAHGLGQRGVQPPAVGGVKGAWFERQRLLAQGELRRADAPRIAHRHHQDGGAALHARALHRSLRLQAGQRGPLRRDVGLEVVGVHLVQPACAFFHRGAGGELELFGDVLAVSRVEAVCAVCASAGIVVLVALNYHDLFALIFDPAQARVAGVRPERLTRLMGVLVALVVVLGVRVVGTLLISGLLVFPAATALQLARRFRAALWIAAGVAAASVLGGIAIAFVFDVPAGAAIILLNALFFAAALLRPRH